MEQSFAEKLKIQAMDRRAAIFEDFVERIAQTIKQSAERAADEGKFSCRFETGSIPDTLLPTLWNKTTAETVANSIGSAIRKKLESCGFTTLEISRNTIGYGSSGRTLKVFCTWN
jgi:hypothetical protein